jgi:hypothetical protein
MTTSLISKVVTTVSAFTHPTGGGRHWQGMNHQQTSAHRWLGVRDVGCDEDTARPGGKAPVIWAILTGSLSPRVRPLACRTRPQSVRARAPTNWKRLMRSSLKVFIRLNETTLLGEYDQGNMGSYRGRFGRKGCFYRARSARPRY